MNLPNQFILTSNKIPVNAAQMPINPHDPVNWITEAEARASGGTYGFVFTPNDPYVFLDFDKCRLPDGSWSPEVTEIFSAFRARGAAGEISTSGNGLHIICRADQSRVADRRNKVDGWREFYSTGRYVQFGPDGWEGDPDVDCTDLILQYVPQRTDAPDVPLHDGPAPEWNGPTDDATLIQLMMASRGGAGTIFGAKATIAQLWEAKADVLSRIYPAFDGNGGFDHSSADAALFAHLAFWTGRDQARMDRLFRQSALMREKYDKRPDYRTATISGAASGCQNVYSAPVRSEPTPALPDTSASISAADMYLNIHDQLSHFAGCVYVRSDHRVLIADGTMLKPNQFEVTYGGHEFAMQADGTKPTKNAFEAFTVNRAHRFPQAAVTVFRPDKPFQSMTDGGVNVYLDPQVRRVVGDATPFLEYLAKLLPDAGDREVLLAYMAAVVQYPGHKFLWSVVIQGTKGNGKSTIGEIINYCVGENYWFPVNPKKITGDFNKYIENRVFLTVEEVHMRNKMDTLDTIKTLITQATVSVEGKGVDQRKGANVGNWMFFTNYKDAMIKERDDRRLAMFFSAQQTYADIVRDGMAGDYFPRLYEWLRADGFAICAEYLMTYAIPVALNPAVTAGGKCHRAPDTTSAEEAIRASRGGIEQEVYEMIDAEEKGFRQGWISSVALTDMLHDRGWRLNRSTMTDMLTGLGYEIVGRSTRGIFEEGGKRPLLYALDGVDRGRDAFETYCACQGYQSGTPRVTVATG